MPVPEVQSEIRPEILFLVRPALPPAPSMVVFFQTKPFQVAILKVPLAASVKTIIGFPLKVVVAISRPSVVKSTGANFQAACGTIDLVMASTEVPNEF